VFCTAHLAAYSNDPIHYSTVTTFEFFTFSPVVRVCVCVCVCLCVCVCRRRCVCGLIRGPICSPCHLRPCYALFRNAPFHKLVYLRCFCRLPCFLFTCVCVCVCVCVCMCVCHGCAHAAYVLARMYVRRINSLHTPSICPLHAQALIQLASCATPPIPPVFVA
jgi:hypothetical protein